MSHPRPDLVLESLNELRGMEEARLRKEAADREARRKADAARLEAQRAEAERLRADEAQALEAQRAAEEARREREATEAREAGLRRELALREEFDARRVAQELRLVQARAELLDAAERRRGVGVLGLSVGAFGLLAIFGAGLWFGVLAPEQARREAELVSLREQRRVAEDARGRAEADRERAEREAVVARERAQAAPVVPVVAPVVVRQPQRVPGRPPVTTTTTTNHVTTQAIDVGDLDGPDPMATDDLAPRARPRAPRR